MPSVKITKETTFTFSKDDILDLLIEHVAAHHGVDVERQAFVVDVRDDGPSYGDFGSAPYLNNIYVKVKEEEE